MVATTTSSQQPFKIKAWPIIDHESSSSYSRTWILWPFIYHERHVNTGTTVFKINPLLLKVERKQNEHFSLSLLFYSFYLNIVFNHFTTLFFLPLGLYIRNSNNANVYWRRIVVFGGLLFYGMFKDNYKRLLIPPLLYSSKDSTSYGSRSLLQIWFPLYWKYKSSTTNLTVIFPMYWRFVNGTFNILQIWPFFGTQTRPNNYVEYSTMYPLFRFRKSEGGDSGEKTVHLLWPFIKVTTKADKFSIRILPFLWIRKSSTASRGYVLFTYWQWLKNEKITVGLFPLVHVKRDLTAKKHMNIMILLLLFWRDTDTYNIRCYTWLHYSRRTQDSYRTLVIPFFYYRRIEKEQTLVVPLCLLYAAYRPDREFELLQLPFFYFLINKPDKERFVWAVGYVFYSHEHNTVKKKLHLIAPLLILLRKKEFVGTNNSMIDLWISPLLRYYYDRENNRDKRNVFCFPLFFYFSSRELANDEMLNMLITPLFLIYRVSQGVLMVSYLFGFKKGVDHITLWILPLFYARIENTWESKVFVLPVLCGVAWFNNRRILVLPFFVAVHAMDLGADGKVDSSLLIVLYGLFVQQKAKEIERVWLFPIFFIQNIKPTKEKQVLASFLLLPPYIYHRSSPELNPALFVVWPFFVKTSDGHSSTLYILPPLIKLVSESSQGDHTFSFFPLFRYESDKRKGQFDIRILFFFKLALLKIRRRRTDAVNHGVHICKTRFHLFPLVFWERKEMMIPEGGITRINTLTVTALTTLKDKYQVINPQSGLTLFGVHYGYGLFHLGVDKQYHAIQLYLFPIFHIESGMESLTVDSGNQGISIKRRSDPKGDTLSIALFWILHPRVSLFYYGTMSHEEWSLERNTTFSIMFLFYIHTNNMIFNPRSDGDIRYRNERTISMLWILKPDWAFIYRFVIFQDSVQHDSRTYILPLFLIDIDRDYQDQNKITVTRSLSLLWFMHKYLTMFYYHDSQVFSRVSNPQNIEIPTIDTNEQLNDEVRLNIAVLNSQNCILEPQPKDWFSFVPILYYVEKFPSSKSFKLSMLWFFVRQASFIRYNKEVGKEVKLVLFPLFKYGRRSGEWSKWCLFPLVPIKYSYDVCLLAREKTVTKRGISASSDDFAHEDKSSREQDVDIRFIYRVIRYKRVNGHSTFEWNPFFNSENNRSDNFSSWDCIGGCIGQRSVARDKECRCCYFFFF